VRAAGVVPAVPIHKDFHPGHVLVGDHVYVIDLDEARRGDPTFDVAHFCSYLELLSDDSSGPAARAAFLQEYVAATGWTDPGSYRSFSCASRMHHSHGKKIVDLAAQSRLPAVYPAGDMVEAGRLLAYDSLRPGRWRDIGPYVDKIFKGAKPGDLPVEQPTVFALIVNLKTPKALGLTIPQTLLLRADEVIQ